MGSDGIFVRAREYTEQDKNPRNQDKHRAIPQGA